MGMADAIPIYGEELYAFDYIDLFGSRVPNVSMFAISNIYQTYPGGQDYPVEVGVLSFGGPGINQSFQNPGQPSINTSLVDGYLYSQGTIASSSYSLHIGSVNCDISGSALFGGYDRSRVLGDVSAQATCDAIASELPVTYQSDYGLYFWSTSDQKYSQIVTASTYLGFTFRKDFLNDANMTIKVPFALLNLTLDTPLVDNPTPYFPCMGTDGTYVLGRAFLQAAFVGVNRGTGTKNWFLGQAPGPNMGASTPTTIEVADTTISGSSSSWEDSWMPYWTELPASSRSNATNATVQLLFVALLQQSGLSR
ncbi:hypothetical protein BO70DRAFT_397494 [Aspergillus heteromorphus CBS 117.55]|uniref:Peptidase A1 domain-containing protein n=1 Tax=Aspergillus heteromorphus CBS 117.55 TaxID=1448321 RepID=A0A317VVB3_9EURO|nr:uncharacterized protein BO70DRAFT_397494 [Aspergillus heteromorphus CBS 117.55]PWY78243.1 hypothetical protein BO70DRAFT_397494 [Aspergillus heteromorphus CBS 117.55]